MLILLSLTTAAFFFLFLFENHKRTSLFRKVQAQLEEIQGLKTHIQELNALLQTNTEEAQRKLQQEQQSNKALVERLRNENQFALIEANKQLDQEIQKLQAEAEAIRLHYQTEARKFYDEAKRHESLAKEQEARLKLYGDVGTAEEQTKQILTQAMAEASSLKASAEKLMKEAAGQNDAVEKRLKQEIDAAQVQIVALLNQAHNDARALIKDAEIKATKIGGDAYVALRSKEALERAETAIQNVIHGYGDRYIIPSHTLLDDLAQHFGHTAAGQSFIAARQISKKMIENGQAASCEYVDQERCQTAVRFVIDAFNGRVDAILSRAKHDNYGTLEQEIKDAFALVNLNGVAFRNSRISEEYLESRLTELKWAVVVQELKLKEREEQRRIREQIREEEKARKEYERAIREAAKQEEILKKAMEEAQKKIDAATNEQKAKFEEQLRTLEGQLKEAEERNQRAISMAQQTKRGHVYIISNEGSFGQNIYKVGLTRRLDPLDRIYELGDASVPFDFDVHALIFSEDAPALETELHKRFLEAQVNKVNHRKEFFRLDLKQMREHLEKDGINVAWTMTAEAAEYKETLAIEKLIKENPAMKERWLQRQLELDPVEELSSALPV